MLQHARDPINKGLKIPAAVPHDQIRSKNRIEVGQGKVVVTRVLITCGICWVFGLILVHIEHCGNPPPKLGLNPHPHHRNVEETRAEEKISIGALIKRW